MVKRVFSFVLLVVILTACVSTHQKNLKVHLQSRYVNKTEPAGEFGSSWWRSFKSDELNSLIQRALASNYDLAIALTKLKEAVLGYRMSKKRLLPEVNTTFSYSRTRRNQSGFKSTSRSASLGFAANYEVDLWSKIRNGIDVYRLEKEKACYYYDTAMISLLSTLTDNWLVCVSVNEKLPILKKRMKILSKKVKLLGYGYKEGTYTLSEYLLARDNLERLKTQLAQLKADYRTALGHIKTILGLKQNDDLTVRTSKLPNILAPLDIGKPYMLLERRPDIRKAYANLKEAYLNVKIAKAERLPQFSLSAQLSYSTIKDSIVDLINNWFYSLAARIAYVLVDFNRAKLNEKIKQVATNGAMLEYKKTVLKAVEEVEDAYIRLRVARKNVNSLKKTIANAKIRLGLARQRYLSGQSDVIAYLSALDSLLAYRMQLVDLQQVYLTDLVNLYQAAGGIYCNEE